MSFIFFLSFLYYLLVSPANRSEFVSPARGDANLIRNIAKIINFFNF